LNPTIIYKIEKGLTQKETAKILGIDPTKLSRIGGSSENKINKNPEIK